MVIARPPFYASHSGCSCGVLPPAAATDTQGAHPSLGGCFCEEQNQSLFCVMYSWRLMSGKPQSLVVQLKMQQVNSSKRSAVFTNVSHLL